MKRKEVMQFFSSEREAFRLLGFAPGSGNPVIKDKTDKVACVMELGRLMQRINDARLELMDELT